MYHNCLSIWIIVCLGKVLVNCLMGMSRSSTCVLAYLMLRQNMTAVEALTEVMILESWR